MKANIGQADQIVRGALGTALILVAGMGLLDGAWQTIALAAGSIGVFTAAAGFCPLYRVLNRSTLRV